jgi:hypothetical protein
MKRVVATVVLAMLVASAQAQTKEAALAAAIATKQKDAVAVLIKQGADVNALYEGTTPLYRAVVAVNIHGVVPGDIEIVELLLSQGADVNAPSDDRDLPLRIAYRFANWEGAFETVEALMAASAGQHARPGEKLTPLHAAHNTRIMQLLLARGARVDARDGTGSTPLFWLSITSFDQSGAELLVQRGADINARNDGGLTALDAATAMRQSTALRVWLASKGVPSSSTSKLRLGLDLRERLARMRLSITAYLLGQRNDDGALDSILSWHDAKLLEAYLPPPYYSSTGKFQFRMDREKFERLHPVLKRPWLSERARDNVIWRISRSGLPGIEQPLLDTLPLASPRSRGEIEEGLARRHFEPLLPYIAEHADDGTYVTCQNLARIGSTAATRVMTRCLARLTELGRGGHHEALRALSEQSPIPKVDFAALRNALPAVMDEKTTVFYFQLIGQYQATSEIPVLIAAMRDNPPASWSGREARSALASFDSEDVQRRIVEELDRLLAAGKIDEPSNRGIKLRYAELKRLSAFYHSGSLERGRTARLYERDKEEVGRYRLSAEQSREARPEQFVREYDDYLGRVAGLAEKYTGSVYADGLRAEVASGYKMLADFTRFTLRRPSDALAYQSKSLQASPASPERDVLADLSAADLFQFDLADRAKALEAYRRAADKLRAAKADPNSWLSRAVSHEIEYLESGKVFSGSLRAEDLGEFFGVVFMAAAGAFGEPDRGLASLSRRESMTEEQRREIEQRLGRLAPSHFTLVSSAPLLSLFSSEQAVLRFMRKHDPGGYWSASLALLALHPEMASERGAEVLSPGVKGEAAQATVLAAAARTFVKERGVSLQAPDRRRATPEGTWQLLLESLRAGDATTVLACFTPGRRAKMEPLFSKMTPSEMRAMADSFKEFALQEGNGDMREAVLARRVGDKRFAGFAYFMRYAGEWKIDEM